MTSATIAQIRESLFPSNSRTTSHTGAGSPASITASRSRLPQPRRHPKQDGVCGELCIKVEEHPSCADAVQNSSRHNTLHLSPGVLFRHGPLDHQKSSIRLVTVLPDLSTEGYIQCSMRCTTTHARYTCLSYAWGEPKPKHLLLVNGQQFYVQKNLFDFLENTARRCPGPCHKHLPIAALMVHLNDDHHWTREQIADWLEHPPTPVRNGTS